MGIFSGPWIGETIGVVWSASSDKHPRQHDIQQEVSSARRIGRETKQKSCP